MYIAASETKEEKTNPEVHANVGLMCLTLKKYDAAIDSLKRALTLNPDKNLRRQLPIIWLPPILTKGMTIKQENTDAALIEFKEALRYKPGEPDIIKMIKELEKK